MGWSAEWGRIASISESVGVFEEGVCVLHRPTVSEVKDLLQFVMRVSALLYGARSISDKPPREKPTARPARPGGGGRAPGGNG